MWPFRRDRSRGVPVYDPADHTRRLTEADQLLEVAKREAVAIRNMPAPLHCWQNLWLHELPITCKPRQALIANDGVQFGTYSIPAGMLPVHLEAWYQAQHRAHGAAPWQC